MIEIWKTIKSHPEYEVSSLGNVRDTTRENRLIGRTIHKEWKSIYVSLRNNTYIDKKYDVIRLSRLVAEAFIGNCPPKHKLVCLDKNELNCCLNNVAYVSIKTFYKNYRKKTKDKFKERLFKGTYYGEKKKTVVKKTEKIPSDFKSDMIGGFNYPDYEFNIEKAMREVMNTL